MAVDKPTSTTAKAAKKNSDVRVARVMLQGISALLLVNVAAHRRRYGPFFRPLSIAP
jgi:hypothetical protein